MAKKYIKWVAGISVLLFFLLFMLSLFFAALIGGDGIQFGDKVAVVAIEGVITDPDSISKQIKEYGERDDIKAIVVRIDSPGGGVGPSQEIYRELKKVSAKKEVVVSMGSVAASGGYYIAAAADKIIANPGTITGSIGVIMEFANLEDLLSKIGMKDDERKLLQDVIDDVHKQFIGIVAENRKLNIDAVKKIADGRIFSGMQAQQMGLVDEIGNFQDAVDIAASMAKIKGKPVVLYPEKERPMLWDVIFGDAASKAIKRLKGGYGLMYLSPYR